MDLLTYLQQEPRARERSHKNRAIGNLILKKYYADKIFYHDDKSKMADMVGEILSLDRKWRKILEENPDLRGTDYKEKDKIEEDYQKSLGYNI